MEDQNRICPTHYHTRSPVVVRLSYFLTQMHLCHLIFTLNLIPNTVQLCFYMPVSKQRYRFV